ncbi:hypothetical protein KUV62_15735 [Salipiger bermudensis]|uniref:hypothetical protein n=1 Tax=Salipiger bermudensis TaxID=344736 RepID=UPI001C99153F|nr:hypothetical protein [Salipiger bermudensis]MBY6005376.1 hypothetical protein [Salipiger bermudensis]
MAKLPSFAPRQEIAVRDQTGRLIATPAFLRWLDLSLRPSVDTVVELSEEQQTQIEQNTIDIAANATQIATNTGNIALNAGNIATNTAAIAANVAAIALLRTDLESVTVKEMESITFADSPHNPGDVTTVLCDASSGAIVVNLTAEDGRVLNIKKTDSTTNAVTLTPATGTVEGSATAPITLSGMSLTVHCDGTNWFIV